MLPALARWAEDHPLDEAAWCRWAGALGDDRRTPRRCASSTGSARAWPTIGLEPSAIVAGLEHRLLAGETAGAVPAGRWRPPRCSAATSSWPSWRDSRRHRLVTLVGVGGVGKTRLAVAMTQRESVSARRGPVERPRHADRSGVGRAGGERGVRRAAAGGALRAESLTARRRGATSAAGARQLRARARRGAPRGLDAPARVPEHAGAGHQPPAARPRRRDRLPPRPARRHRGGRPPGRRHGCSSCGPPTAVVVPTDQATTGRGRRGVPPPRRAAARGRVGRGAHDGAQPRRDRAAPRPQLRDPPPAARPVGRLPRHQTLVAAITWSYDLLDAPERDLLDRLSVFAGSFDLAAVEQICATARDAGDAAGPRRPVAGRRRRLPRRHPLPPARHHPPLRRRPPRRTRRDRAPCAPGATVVPDRRRTERGRRPDPRADDVAAAGRTATWPTSAPRSRTSSAQVMSTAAKRSSPACGRPCSATARWCTPTGRRRRWPSLRDHIGPATAAARAAAAWSAVTIRRLRAGRDPRRAGARRRGGGIRRRRLRRQRRRRPVDVHPPRPAARRGRGGRRGAPGPRVP